ncbi:MAG TPA: hypothetical protein VK155_17305 [Bacteroidales bacterium]|jgi:hypothetical protein|nr:hypothetical protein [Bacteroidales bacterium]
MRRDEDSGRDVLKEYFNRTNIEKAPEGFTSKVMSHIYMQAKPARHKKKSPVPLLYAGMTGLLIIASLLLPEGTLRFPEISFPDWLRITFPQIGEGIKISPLMIYILAAAILLIVFDSGLKTLFRKEKN